MTSSIPIYRRQGGFTMIEMIGVLAVIAILASIIAPKIFDAIRDSKINAVASNIQAVQTAVANYYKDTGQLPSSASDLVSAPSGVSNWKGPYLDKGLDKLFSAVSSGTAVLVKEAPTSAHGYALGTSGTNSYANKTWIISVGIPSVDPADGKAISDVVDGDASGNWYADGRIVQDTYTATAAPTVATDLYAFIAAF
ncbi:MAG: prepilin-type N-terminal cleavage/methylation domain-containing protein [Zetaproteobacteria bacterium]|nr:MAG: prepilin-type N-terminal cleavage/methylation domain-containing protein [Zetaproteobacteria bacterium]